MCTRSSLTLPLTKSLCEFLDQSSKEGRRFPLSSFSFSDNVAHNGLVAGKRSLFRSALRAGWPIEWMNALWLSDDL